MMDNRCSIDRVTWANLRRPCCRLDVLTIVSQFGSRGDLIGLLVQMRASSEEHKCEFFEEMVGRVRFSQDSEGDFGKGSASGIWKWLSLELLWLPDFTSRWLSKSITSFFAAFVVEFWIRAREFSSVPDFIICWLSESIFLSPVLFELVNVIGFWIWAWKISWSFNLKCRWLFKSILLSAIF